MDTATVPLKELMAVAKTLILEPLLPAVRVSDAGETAREKSATGAAAETVRANGAEWLSVPEVAVKVTAALPAAALELAVSVTFCAVPGVKVSFDRLAVTPEGSSVMDTATVPLKELIAVARTLSWEPALPAVRASDEGEMLSEKSVAGGAAAMVAATVAEWLSVPEVPVRVMVELPAAAVAAAVISTVCAAPGVKVNFAGFAVTPAGRPEIVTATVPVKPFCEAALTLIVCAWPPGVSAIVAGVEDSEKSAGCVGLTAEWAPPPQDRRPKHINERRAADASFRRGCSRNPRRETLTKRACRNANLVLFKSDPYRRNMPNRAIKGFGCSISVLCRQRLSLQRSFNRNVLFWENTRPQD